MLHIPATTIFGQCFRRKIRKTCTRPIERNYKMKKPKKIVLLLLFVCLVLGTLSSCHSAEEETPESTAEEVQTNPDLPCTEKENITVCIDPGHGFDDVGCELPYMDMYEYEITLLMAELLRDKLEQEGITVILTHDGKIFPSAGEITALADQYNLTYKPEKIIDNNVFSAYERVIWENILDQQTEGGLDLFVSLHVNSIEDEPQVSGMSIDFCEDNPNLSFLRSFSKDLKKVYLDANLTDNFTIFENTYEDSFIVTKYTEVPSVLIEMGYSTNIDDAKKLRSEEWQDQFTSLLCERICYAFGK